MSEQAASDLSCGDPSQGGPRSPLGGWWQPSRLSSQDVGLPPLLEPGDPRWTNVDRLQRSLAACCWPGYVAAPLFAPYISGSTRQSSQKTGEERYWWRVSLDVAHFSPAEISVSVRAGFLEVRGKHEERPDQHGFTARCFTRKYRLPADVDVTRMASALSVDGVLTVEAPVPEASVPAAVIIPIKVEADVDKPETEETLEPDPDSSRAPKAQSVLGGLEDPPLEAQADQAPPGSSTAGLQQHEEGREPEVETHKKPAGESASADGEDVEICQDSSEEHEAPKSQESPDTGAPREPEREEPAVNGEVQVTAASGGAAEQIPQPEEPQLGKAPPQEVRSQELEVPDVKQEHTE